MSAVPVQVEVTDQPPVVETERGGQTSSVTERHIENLPIDRRDYLSFTLLTPGVSNSNVLADNADFRVQQTPQSGLSFYRSNGRGNSISADGGEANDDAGGAPSNKRLAVIRFRAHWRDWYPKGFGLGGSPDNQD